MFYQLYPNSLLEMKSKSGKKLPDSDLKCSYILSIIHNLTYQTSSSISKLNQEKGVPLSSVLLRKVIGRHYKKYINNLIRLNLIEKTCEHKIGTNSIKYRLVDYNGGAKLSNNKYYNIFTEHLRLRTKNKLTYDKQYVADKMTETLNTVCDISIEGKRELKNNMYNQPFYVCQKSLLNTLMGTENMIVTDKSGARLYGSHTTISKKLRQHILINNQRQLMFDIKNSQFQFLSSEMMSNGYNQEDFIRFSKICHSGRIYEYFMDKLNCDRKTTKDLLINWLYSYSQQSTSKKLQPIQNIFETEFPSVLEYVMVQKSKGGKLGSSNFAVRLQEKEASIITSIQKKLFLKGISNLSTHDSISVDTNVKTIDGQSTIEWVLYEFLKLGFDISGIDIVDYQEIWESEKLRKWINKEVVSIKEQDKELIKKYLGKGEREKEKDTCLYVAHLTNSDIKTQRNKIQEFDNLTLDFLNQYKKDPYGTKME